MKGFWMDLILILVIGALLDNFLFYGNKQQDTEMDPTGVQEVHSVWLIPVRFGPMVQKMDLEEYITGAVLGEMPIWFEAEALKAQAVAARTFALKAFTTGGKHGDSSVCTDPNCCQAYQEPGEETEKIRQAVYETAGQVLCYDGELIDAVYFSCSGGSTEEAAAVWGQAVPYLQAVSSPGEEDAGAFFQQRKFSRQELEKALGVELPQSSQLWFQRLQYTSGGGVETVQIGEKTWTGVELRRLLELPSTRFTVKSNSGGVVLNIYGFGHRVGMSQYGADAMAAAGENYRNILAHYYQGTDLVDYSQKTREKH